MQIEDIKISAITIDRSTRQRRALENIDDLAESIQRNGLFHPVILSSDNTLIAGERRLEAHKLLGRTHISAHFMSDLSQLEQDIIELDENVKRDTLPWDDQTAACLAMHKKLIELNGDEWDQSDTAEYIGYSPAHVSKMILVGEDIASGDTKVASANSLNSAYTTASRSRSRRDADLLNSISEDLLGEAIDIPDEPAPAPDEFFRPAEKDILNVNFAEWIESYKGNPFNVIHCDFPYGINHGKSDQGGVAAHGGYDDAPDVYWALCKTFVENVNKIMYPSSHMIFWFSMNYYQETIDYFTKHTDLKLVQPHPLIWHKSDNAGVVADVHRRPRHTYETALFFSRGDRKIVGPVADSKSAPTTKNEHVSEKSQPMLEHFLRMVIDPLSEVFDPTCGSGSALRAAERLGAKRVLGLELSPDNSALAALAMNNQRKLDAASLELDL